MKSIKLTLPTFAFLEGYGEKDDLAGRNVIMHVRSASVVEIFNRDDVVLNEDVISFNFTNRNPFRIKEPMVAALHYSATLDEYSDREMIINEVLKPAAKWYCEYCDWEDKNICDKTC